MTNIVSLRALANPGDAESSNKALAEFDAKVKAVPFTAAEKAKAAELAKRPSGSYTELVTPGVASAIWQFHNNGYNRDFRISKALQYAEEMRNGGWRAKAAHAIHFYGDDNGNLANGQHRTAAIALSGATIEVQIVTAVTEDDMRAMDRGGTRTVADTLGMIGVVDPRFVAFAAKGVLGYQQAFSNPGGVNKLSERAVEAFVVDNRAKVDLAVMIGKNSTHNVEMPSIDQRRASTIALLMLMGGWDEQHVRAFLAGVQTGLANAPDSPILIVNKLLSQARDNAEAGDKMKGNNLLGTVMKAASAWSRNLSVTKNAIRFKATATSRLPDYRMPVAEPPVASAAE